jgi:hypothetical protein
MRRAPAEQWVIPVVWAIFLAAANPAGACSACFGQSDSRLAQGMNMGILSLLVVVIFVLSSIGAFFIYLARRSAQRSAKPAPQVLEPTNQI